MVAGRCLLLLRRRPATLLRHLSSDATAAAAAAPLPAAWCRAAAGVTHIAAAAPAGCPSVPPPPPPLLMVTRGNTPPPPPAPARAARSAQPALRGAVLAGPAVDSAAVAAWDGTARRFFSQQRQERRRRVAEDVRRTGQQVRATVGHIVTHENIYTVPNALCVTRIALTPALGWLVTTQAYGPALACFMVAGVTDLLDGWIARRYPSQASRLGSFLDPLADKLLMATLFLSLTYTGLIPLSLTLLTVARDLGLITAAAWVRYKSVPPPVTLSRYFDPTFATAQLEPTLISKFNTCLQLLLVASTLAAPVLGFVDHTALRVLWCVTAGTTVTSGMVYALLQSSTYKLMDRDDSSQTL